MKNYVLEGTSGIVYETESDKKPLSLEDVFKQTGPRTLAILNARHVLQSEQGARIEQQAVLDPDLFVIWGTENDYVDPDTAPGQSPLTIFVLER